MSRGLRCLFGFHTWAKRVVEGEAHIVCVRCGKVEYGGNPIGAGPLA